MRGGGVAAAAVQDGVQGAAAGHQRAAGGVGDGAGGERGGVLGEDGVGTAEPVVQPVVGERAGAGQGLLGGLAEDEQAAPPAGAGGGEAGGGAEGGGGVQVVAAGVHGAGDGGGVGQAGGLGDGEGVEFGADQDGGAGAVAKFGEEGGGTGEAAVDGEAEGGEAVGEQGGGGLFGAGEFGARCRARYSSTAAFTSARGGWVSGAATGVTSPSSGTGPSGQRAARPCQGRLVPLSGHCQPVTAGWRRI